MHIPPCEIEAEKRIDALQAGISYSKPMDPLTREDAFCAVGKSNLKNKISVYALNADMIAWDYNYDAQSNG